MPSIRNWAAAVWDADPPPDVLQAAWRTASKRAVRREDPSAAAVGPAAAFLANLFRVGWRSPAWHTVLTRSGRIIDMLTECPRTVARFYTDDLQWVIAASSTVAQDFIAVEKGRARHDGRRPDDEDRPSRMADWPSARLSSVSARGDTRSEDLHSVPWFAPAAAAVAATGRSALTAKGRAMAVSLTEGGWWSPAAKHQAGMISSGACPACGHEPCDHAHLSMFCRTLREEKVNFPHGKHLFDHAEANPTDILYVRGVPEHPELPQPPPERIEVVRPPAASQDPVVYTGFAFPDGAVSSRGPRR